MTFCSRPQLEREVTESMGSGPIESRILWCEGRSKENLSSRVRDHPSVWVEGLLVRMGESKLPWWVYKGASIWESSGCCKRPTVQVCVAVAVGFLTEMIHLAMKMSQVCPYQIS